MHKYRSLFAWQQAHKIAVLERAMAALHGLLRKPITTAR